MLNFLINLVKSFIYLFLYVGIYIIILLEMIIIFFCYIFNLDAYKENIEALQFFFQKIRYPYYIINKK
jgi:hypothetical protein